MAFEVMYTGETNGKLHTDFLYTVERVIGDEKKECYFLKGIETPFKSSLFESIDPKQTFVGLLISQEPPKEGGRLENFVRYERGKSRKVARSSVIEKVVKHTNRVYEVHTQNVLYFIQYQTNPPKKKRQ